MTQSGEKPKETTEGVQRQWGKPRLKKSTTKNGGKCGNDAKIVDFNKFTKQNFDRKRNLELKKIDIIVFEFHRSPLQK